METMKRAGVTLDELTEGMELLSKAMKSIDETYIIYLIKTNPNLSWQQKRMLARKMRKAIKRRKG